MATVPDSARLTEVAARLNAVRVLAGRRGRAGVDPEVLLDGILKLSQIAAVHLAVVREWAA